MTAAPKSGLLKGLKSESPSCCFVPAAVTRAPYFRNHQNAPNCIVVWHESVIYRAGLAIQQEFDIVGKTHDQLDKAKMRNRCVALVSILRMRSLVKGYRAR